jgi:ATP-binding cassette subfamily C protein CydD
MTTDQAWLSDAATPGRRWLLLAAGSQAVETAFTVVQWAGLALVAQDVLDGGRPSWLASGVLLGGGLLSAAAAWSTARLQAVGRRRIAEAIRLQLVAGLLSGQRTADPDPATAAVATVELTDDVADFHAQALPQRVSAPVSMAVVLAVTAFVQWPAAVILLLASLLLPLNLRLAGLFAKEGADSRMAASTRLAAVVLDSFRGMSTLRNIGALGRRRTELARAAGDLNATTLAVVRRATLSGAVMDVVITFSIAANATYVGLSLLGYVRIGAGMTLFRGLLALLICPLYFQPMRAVAAAFHNSERALSAVPAIRALLVEPENPVVAGDRVPPSSEPVIVVLSNVSLQFPTAEEPTLHRVNLTVHAGGWTAVSGPSAAGKTTLLSLIAGVREPSHGTVRWLTPTGASAPWLGGCAWIGQQTILLPGSVGDNVRIGRPDASRVDIERAVAAAGLAEVVARLPQGLDTPLGEGGSGLSTGEVRRIAIARAFLSDAGLWVLDEPTAHLDAATESQIIVALRNATQGRTVIVATHSAALARSADLLLGLADGTVHTVREAIQV